MKFYKPFLRILATICLLTACFYKGHSAGDKSLLRHIVTVTFKAGATQQQIRAVDNSFKNLSVKLTMVKAYEWGVVNDPKDTLHIKHVYVTTFANTKDEADYGASPLHQAHIKLGDDYIQQVQAIDFFVKQ
jgi:hypothetical protein